MKKDFYWYIGGTYLLIVNIIRMIWLITNEDWLQILWLSQIIGLIEAAVFFTRASKPLLNGFYLALALLPFMGVLIFLPLGADFLFWLNHVPQFFLIYFFFHREKVDSRGFEWSLLLLFLMLNISWYVQYLTNNLSMAINTTTSPFFPVVLLIGLTWYLFVRNKFKKHGSEI